MSRFEEKRFTLIGMSLAVVLGLIITFFSLKALLKTEADRYGKDFIENLFVLSGKLDQALTSTITKEVYDNLHQKKLKEVRLTVGDHIQSLQSQAREILGTQDLLTAIFSDCPHDGKQSVCYIEADPVRVKVKAPLSSDYSPKSRPWYLATRSHTDWVLIQFMVNRSTLLSGYPPTWGTVFVKHFIYSNEEEENWKIKATNKDYLIKSKELDNGIWFSMAMFEKNYFGPNSIFLKTKDRSKFTKFDFKLKTLRFPKKLSHNMGLIDVDCQASTEIISWQYKAVVPCEVNGESVRISFVKYYDHNWHLFAISFLFLVFLLFNYLLLRYVEDLRSENLKQTIDLEKGRLVNAVGAKLIHDLKKGTITQLNQLYHEYGEDLELEMSHIGFKERLKNNLSHHFKYLRFLNKYIKLMTNNIKRQRETDWVMLSVDRFQDYVNWVVGKIDIEIKTSNNESSEFLEFFVAESVEEKKLNAVLKVSSPYPGFSVPEMAFYRIFKNIWENYIGYGDGDFKLTLSKDGDMIQLMAVNKIQSKSVESNDSTQLGLIIIQQLFVDNFGEATSMHYKEENEVFCLEVLFSMNRV